MASATEVEDTQVESSEGTATEADSGSEQTTESKYLSALADSFKLDGLAGGTTTSTPAEPKSETSSAKGAEDKGGVDFSPIDEADLAELEDEVGAKAGKVLRSLVARVNAMSKAVGAAGKHAKILDEIEKIAPRLGNLTRMTEEQQEAHWDEIHDALDDIAEAGGADAVGKNRAEREANFAKYENNIRKLYLKGEEAKRLYKSFKGRKDPKRTQGECMVDAWKQIKQSRADKADPARNPGLKAMQDAQRDQARRSNAASVHTAAPRGVQSQPKAGAEGARSLVRQFVASRAGS